MTNELETYFANYNEMFNSAGWKQLIGDLQVNVVQLCLTYQLKWKMLKKTHRSLLRKKKLRQKQRPLPKKSDAETV